MFGQHCIRSWCSTQASIALSSGEAEFYGVVKASSVGLGILAMQKDMNVNCSLDVFTDAEAAKGIASRRGLGRTRHIAVHLLWVQERVAQKEFRLLRVQGKENPADICTKHLDFNHMQELMHKHGLYFEDGRADACPLLSHLRMSSSIKRAPH